MKLAPSYQKKNMGRYILIEKSSLIFRLINSRLLLANQNLISRPPRKHQPEIMLVNFKLCQVDIV